jgi:hypothetical protein
MTEEIPVVDISDSVIMGDVQQNILKTDECSSCSSSNVKVLKCQEKQCTSINFCELCHLNCRYEMGEVWRFDSGRGAGPFCSECLSAKIVSYNEQIEQLKRQGSCLGCGLIQQEKSIRCPECGHFH